MEKWRIRYSLLLEEPPAAIDKAYGREVRWDQGFRVNLDSRLILLGLRRFMRGGGLTEDALRHSDFVLGCRLGTMDSYEKFDASLKAAAPAPLAFAYALPSMPMACASLYYGLHGQTYTLVGEAEVGIRALRQAVALITAGRSRQVIFGCWESPSQTAGSDPDRSNCRLLLALVEAGSEASTLITMPDSRPSGDCVSSLAEFLGGWMLPDGAENPHG